MSAVVEARQPVAMRLPRKDVEAVEKYARDNGITKTDAFLHFLHCGMQSESQAKDNRRLEAIEGTLQEILSRLPTANSLSLNAVISAIVTESRNFDAIKRAILFGSFARGEATANSDIDVRLEIDESGTFSLYDLARFQKAVGQRTGREVEALTAKDISNENLAAAIAREGIVAYEREGKRPS